ncbi:protein kinase [Bacillus sp. JCM 19045]|nr:protein kinase [Bacillus sp. JCM 19045]
MDSIINKLARQYGADQNSVHLIGGFNKNVYQFTQNQQEYVLKCYKQNDVHKENVQDEVNTLELIKDAGVRTAEILRSVSGNKVEAIADNQKLYYAFAMDKIGGGPLTEWKKNPNWVLLWGKSMGQFHNLLAVKRTNENVVFPEWEEETLFEVISKEFDSELVQKWNWFMKQLQQLTKKEKEYGVIHHDLHHENIHLWREKMYLLDFGDVRYHWYIYDIAIAIYHAMQTVHSSERSKRFKEFSTRFIEGYRSEHPLTEHQIEQLPFFLCYREIYSYLYLSLHAKGGKELQQALSTMRHRILKNEPLMV